jgi:hypothetical protein
VRLGSPSRASFVEILKGSAVCGSPEGRTLEDIFQIMIVVAVESANGQEFLGALELSALETYSRCCKFSLTDVVLSARKVACRIRAQYVQFMLFGNVVPESFHTNSCIGLTLCPQHWGTLSASCNPYGLTYTEWMSARTHLKLLN